MVRIIKFDLVNLEMSETIDWCKTEKIHESWIPIFVDLVEKYPLDWAEVTKILTGDRGDFLPEREDVFRVFRMSLSDIRVVILGQDPYHTPGIANGLAFSSKDPAVIPPSLRNIFREIGIPSFADLSGWMDQGVFLLNTALTVAPGLANSHSKYWKNITDFIIVELVKRRSRPIIFCLWGAFAQSKASIIDESSDIVILKAVHPSPLSASRGWFGSDHFGKVNQILAEREEELIDWSSALAK
jgi:uracil-DNA glycosylase